MSMPKDPIKAKLWKDRQSKAQKGVSKNKGEANPFYGKRHTDKTKQKISMAISGEGNGNFGKPRPQNVRDAVSKAHKGKVSPFKGHHLSDEAKQLISNVNRGKKYRLGKRLTPEQRLNISNGTKAHALRGKDNPRWKGGISPENQKARYSFEYEEWRRKVFERDHFICQKCGYSKGKILIAHHIKSFAEFPELRLDIDNGITVCKPCHELIE